MNATLPCPAPAFDVDEWFREQMRRPENLNPCVRLYGLGPVEFRCKHCRLLFKHQPAIKSFFKCELRNLTHGPGSDHRANWPACGRFEPKNFPPTLTPAGG